MTAGLDVRVAQAGDVDEIVAILSEAARWLLGRGIRQWPDPFPRDRVAALVRRGELYVARLEGEAVATLALLWSDPTFWGERPDDAGYVHALAVRRSHAGTGLGGRLLDWAEQQAVAAGRPFLRLDCLAGNAELRLYYERHGFEARGEVAVDDFVSALYERRCRTGGYGGPGSGEIVTLPARTRDRHARPAAVRSQRERGWLRNPTQLKGGGALGG